MKESDKAIRQNTSRYLITKALLLALVVPLFLSGCDDVRVQTVRWVEYEPVYISQEEFMSAAAQEEPRELTEPGKIYLHDGYLFVNEVNKGVHIIDNRDPSAPAPVGFVNIPANKDLAVRGDRLYADSHSDLLVFDISDMENAELITRVEDVFIESANEPPGFPFREVDASQGVVVDWEPVVVEEECTDDCPELRGWNLASAEFAAADGGGTQAGGSEAAGGVGGSMARFAITGEYMYAVDEQNLVTFDISAAEPSKVKDQTVGWAIETIFPYEESLYIGSETAMYIYDVSDPLAPERLSVYNHAKACDPVVVEGTYAYVTLREGPRCPNRLNRLEVVDVEDRAMPEQVAFYEMINPHGLGIDDGRLFVSEGEHGLKVLDASDPLNVEELHFFEDIETFDVIPFEEVLIATGPSGIVQYDYSDIDEMRHLSTLSVAK